MNIQSSQNTGRSENSDKAKSVNPADDKARRSSQKFAQTGQAVTSVPEVGYAYDMPEVYYIAGKEISWNDYSKNYKGISIK